MNKYLKVLIFLSIPTSIIFFNTLRVSGDGIIIVAPGMSAGSVVGRLIDSGAVNRASSSLLKVILSKKGKVGNYTYVDGESILSLARRIVKGASDECTISFIPGLTLHEYKKQLTGNAGFYGSVSSDIKEGDILPDTYTHKCQTHRNIVLLHARRRMDDFLDGILSDIDWERFYLGSRNDVVILASIVEKEAGTVEEMGIIASVFKNRLRIGMRLQTDPTVIYQKTGGERVGGIVLTTDDLGQSGSYNTYKISGLPVGAIASPSKRAIIAVVNPRETKFLYFVANGKGGHNFSKTYEEHLQYVKQYRAITGGSST